MTRHSAADTPSGAGRRRPAPGLPPRYLPRIARFSRGPFIEPRIVTPTDLRWRDARTYVVQDYDEVLWRCLRVTIPGGHHYGYWAIELLGVSLMGPG